MVQGSFSEGLDEVAIVGCREIGASGTKSPRRRRRPALEVDAIDDTSRPQVIVETLSHDIGERTAFALRQFLGGRGLLFRELDLGTNHAITITDRVSM